MLPDPRPNLELGLAAFSLLPVLFSPLFAENRPEPWHRPPSVEIDVGERQTVRARGL